MALDLIPDYTLADVAMNIDRLDMTFLRRSLCKHATGLSLLPHPVQMEDIGLIHEDHLGRVIGLLRASYSHLVFDLSKRFTPTDLTAMRMADVILLVAQLELTSLRNVVRMLHTLGNEEGLGDKVQGHHEPRRLRRRRHHPGKGRGDASASRSSGRCPTITRPMLGARNAGVPLLDARAQEQGAPEPGRAGQRPVRQDQRRAVKKERRGFFSFR